jgi:hypothetical protein
VLYLVLGLVLAAFGLLIAALTTANTLFAWVSVAVSVIAAGLLVFDWLSGRRRARDAAEEAEPDPVLTRPEQPFGDETPPLTETRRRAVRREERAAQREDDRDAHEAPAEPDDEPDFEAEPVVKRVSTFTPIPAYESTPASEPESRTEPEPRAAEPVPAEAAADTKSDSNADADARADTRTGAADTADAVSDTKADATADTVGAAVAGTAREDSPPNGSEPADLGEAESALTGPPRDERPAERPAGEDQPREERTAVLSGRRAQEARRTVVDEHGEPGEEPTDATDLLIVTDLPDEVRVVDEHPRYHLAACTYLHDKPTIPLPVSEARQLGFTPCIRCGPDATLAARHRASR